MLIDSAELQDVIVSHVTKLTDRLLMRATCKSFSECCRRPENWRALRLGNQPAPPTVLRVVPRSMVESLSVSLQIPLASFSEVFHLSFDAQAELAEATLGFPRLCELDLSTSTVVLSVLHQAFLGCGETLRRLDLSSVRRTCGMQTHANNNKPPCQLEPHSTLPLRFAVVRAARPCRCGSSSLVRAAAPCG